MRWSLYKYKCLWSVGTRAVVQVSNREFHTYIHLDQAIVEFLSQGQGLWFKSPRENFTHIYIQIRLQQNFYLVLKKKKSRIYSFIYKYNHNKCLINYHNDQISYLNKTFTLCLFRWKTLCKDSFLYFRVFGNIRINESKENYFQST